MPFPSGFEHFVRENEPLAPHTWLQLGGKARYFAEPTSHNDLVALVQACNRIDLPIRVLGGGSNLLVREKGFPGVVVSLAAPAFSQISVDGNVAKAGGGAKLAHLVSQTVGAGLAGLEHLVGIPGTVGGALRGNASTLDGDIGQRVRKATYLTHQGEVVQVEADRLQFSYHQSSLDELVILEAEFALEQADPKTLTKRMQTLWIVKRASQPPMGSAAAIPFVDPDGASAASLIDQVQMRGEVEGQVQLSSSFENFVTVSTGATSDQLLALLERVQAKVAEKTGVQLQLHLRIW